MPDNNLKQCNVDVILFDFGGVLAEEGFRDGLQAIAENKGLDPDSFVKKSFDLVHGIGYVVGKSDEKAFWRALREETGINGTDKKLRNVILMHFKLRPWMIDLIKKLKQQDIRLGILSDQTNWLDELNEKYDFFKWFDHIFNSYYIGKSKKDPTLFDDVLDWMAVKSDRVLFVDDHHANIERARQKGLNAILYDDFEKFYNELAEFCPLEQ